MAARANLKIDSELIDAFTKGHDGSLRYIQAQVQGETVTSVGSAGPAGTAAQDFESILKPLLKTNEATFIIFALDAEDGHVQWVLLTYIPDLALVRHKMLYSSSRDDLKRSLGLAFFAGDFNANALEEVSYAAMKEAISKSPHEDAPLTNLEKLVIEEKALEKDTNIRSTAMGVVPFHMMPEVKEAVSGLRGGANNWVELALDPQKESVGLVSCKHVVLVPDALPAIIPEAEARFFVVKTGSGSVILVYSCPESAPIRQKMTYSTAKATVVAELNALGVSLDRVTEIRQGADIVGALELDEPSGKAEGKDGSVQHNLAHAKPTRPGRGRARLIGKTDDSLGNP